MESVAYVGMDVDKKKIAMAVVAGYEAQPRVQRIVPNNLAALRKFFGELTEQYENVTACYEAGCVWFRAVSTGNRYKRCLRGGRTDLNPQEDE
jgi:hypothetical protein